MWKTLRQLSAATALIISLCLSQPGSADEPEIPDTGWLTEEVYIPALDALCAGGTDLSRGCDAVRAREIMDASAYPWSAIGRVNFASIRFRWHCTGTLIGERLVLTAAHCLYNSGLLIWIPAGSIRFLAGYQRGEYVAFSKSVRYIVEGVHDTNSRHFKVGPDTDWALIELEDPIGVTAGYLGITAFDQTGLDHALASGAKVSLPGYPQIRQHVLSLATDCGAVKLPVTINLVVHRCTAMWGDSGAPILLVEDGKTTVIGLMSGIVSRGDDLFGVAPSALAFRSAVLDILGSDRDAQVPSPHEITTGEPPAR